MMKKFEDIKKFHKSYYNIHIEWDYLENWLENMAERGGADSFQLNPDFQRGHVWDRNQQIAYLEYILRGGESGRELHFNHPGWQTDYKGDMVCVDGLQRITAVRRFMDNAIPVFGSYLNEYKDRKYIRNCHFIVHVGSLKSKREVLEWYIQMNEGGTPHSEAEISRVKELMMKVDYE